MNSKLELMIISCYFIYIFKQLHWIDSNFQLARKTLAMGLHNGDYFTNLENARTTIIQPYRYRVKSVVNVICTDLNQRYNIICVPYAADDHWSVLRAKRRDVNEEGGDKITNTKSLKRCPMLIVQYKRGYVVFILVLIPLLSLFNIRAI